MFLRQSEGESESTSSKTAVNASIGQKLTDTTPFLQSGKSASFAAILLTCYAEVFLTFGTTLGSRWRNG